VTRASILGAGVVDVVMMVACGVAGLVRRGL